MGKALVLRAIVPVEEQRYDAESHPHAEPQVRNASRQLSGATPVVSAPTPDARTAGLIHSLRCLHLLFRSERLYDRNHPRRLQSLDASYETLHDLAGALNGIEIHIERSGLVAPKLSDAHLPDVRGEMQSLAQDLQRAGIQSLAFARQFHVGELDTLAQLFKASLLRSEESIKRGGSAWWAARFLENRVEGISINTQTERKVDTVLASLMGALVAYGGNSPREVNEVPILPPEMDDLAGALRLIARLTPPLEAARGPFAGRSGACDSRSNGRCEPRDGAHAAQLHFAVCSARGRTSAALSAAPFGKFDSRVPRSGIFRRDACTGRRSPDVS